MVTAESMKTLTPEPDDRRQLRRAVIASTVGTTIEWYDFFLYSTVTGLAFAQLYFPKSDPLVGTLQAFAIYAVGFVARPVGAAIFGHYGDRCTTGRHDEPHLLRESYILAGTRSSAPP
jgi:MFS family permease